MRNFWFRAIHLVMIGIVVGEALAGVPARSPSGRSSSGPGRARSSYTGDFLGYWAHRLIFYRAEPWVFTLIYAAFGLAVLATFVLAPPRWPVRKPTATGVDKEGEGGAGGGLV